MATKQKVAAPVANTIDFDIAEFRRQKTLMDQHASKGIAERIEAVKALLREVKDLAELSGNTSLKLGGSYGILADLIEEIDSRHEDWNSSSYEC